MPTPKVRAECKHATCTWVCSHDQTIRQPCEKMVRVMRYFFHLLNLVLSASTIPSSSNSSNHAHLIGDNKSNNLYVNGFRGLHTERPVDLISILEVGNSGDDLGKRQSPSGSTQSNFTETFSPPKAQRWTLSIEAQLKDAPVFQNIIPHSKCTLRICLGDGVCGALKSLGTDWVKVSLITQLPANITQSAVFVTSCSGPISIALRNMNVPGRVLVITRTATMAQMGVVTLPAVTQTVT